MAELKFPDFSGETGAQLNTAGTPYIDLSASSAATNHRTFANAASDTNIDFDDGDTIAVDIIDTSGNTATWIATWASGTSRITRVSVEAAQGTLVTTAGAITVYASVPGNWFKELEGRNRWVSTAGTDADTTMVVNTTPYLVDMSAWATANRTYTLPATFAVGDVVEIHVTAGNATYALIIKPAAGDDINGGTAGAELTRLFITGEKMRLRGTVANTSWVVEHDGRIPCMCIYQGLISSLANGTSVYDLSALTEHVNLGDIGDTTNDKIVSRRNEKQEVVAAAYLRTGITADENLWVQIRRNTGGGLAGFNPLNRMISGSTTDFPVGVCSTSAAVQNATYEWDARVNNGDASGAQDCDLFLSVKEIL